MQYLLAKIGGDAILLSYSWATGKNTRRTRHRSPRRQDALGATSSHVSSRRPEMDADTGHCKASQGPCSAVPRRCRARLDSQAYGNEESEGRPTLLPCQPVLFLRHTAPRPPLVPPQPGCALLHSSARGLGCSHKIFAVAHVMHSSFARQQTARVLRGHKIQVGDF